MIQMAFVERVVFADDTDCHGIPPKIMMYLLYRGGRGKSNRFFCEKSDITGATENFWSNKIMGKQNFML